MRTTFTSTVDAAAQFGSAELATALRPFVIASDRSPPAVVMSKLASIGQVCRIFPRAIPQLSPFALQR